EPPAVEPEVAPHAVAEATAKAVATTKLPCRTRSMTTSIQAAANIRHPYVRPRRHERAWVALRGHASQKLDRRSDARVGRVRWTTRRAAHSLRSGANERQRGAARLFGDPRSLC